MAINIFYQKTNYNIIILLMVLINRVYLKTKGKKQKENEKGNIKVKDQQ